MKARGKYRRFFKKNVYPNICVLENVTFEAHEVKSYLDAVNPDLFTIELSTLLYQFKEANNFGAPFFVVASARAQKYRMKPPFVACHFSQKGQYFGKLGSSPANYELHLAQGEKTLNCLLDPRFIIEG